MYFRFVTMKQVCSLIRSLVTPDIHRGCFQNNPPCTLHQLLNLAQQYDGSLRYQYDYDKYCSQDEGKVRALKSNNTYGVRLDAVNRNPWNYMPLKNNVSRSVPNIVPNVASKNISYFMEI